jgi:hypothetical protein
MLKRIDVLWDNALIIIYLVLTALGIVILHLRRAEILKHPLIVAIHDFIPFAMQFAFGGLFSMFTIFYFRGGSLTASWPFVLIMFGLLIGNEFFKEYYDRLPMQASIHFVALFSYLVFSVPIVLDRMGPSVFLLSGVLALGVEALLIAGLAKVLPALVKKNRNAILASVVLIYIFLNIMYFGDLIPPVPLSLKDAGIFHAVSREGSGYSVVYEKESWLARLFEETIHIQPSDTVYVYSSVFAPGKLSTDIKHDWQWFDETKGRWVPLSSIPFPISGGREEGYRGYSSKNFVPEGHWRVDVETGTGQVIGRVRFKVEYVNQVPQLYTELR